MSRKLILLTLTFLACALGISAQTTATIDGIGYQLGSTTAAVISNTPKYTGIVVIPSQVTYSGTTYNVTSIGNNAFSYCSGLTSVTIPSSVTSIGNNAFPGCTGLTSVTIPSSVTSIGDYAFSGCTGLTSVTIPSSVTSIGGSSFSYCSGLTSVSISSSVTCISSYAFRNCSGLTAFTIPSSVTSIGQSAFSGCTGLTSVTIPSSVTFISDDAFVNCMGLTSVTIPSSVTHIGMSAFYNCSGLTSVTIPSSVTYIGSSAFYNCTSLKQIYAYSVNPKSVSSSTFTGVSTTTCTLYVPAGSKAAYQAAAYWQNFTNIVEMTTAVPQIHGREIQPVYNAVTGTLQLTGLEESATVALYNMQGRLVYSGICNNATCRVSALPAGVYVLKVTVDKETATMKVVM